MLFRALFCIALVSMLMPREPNLGFGRPDASLATFFPQVSQAASGRPCQRGPAECAAGLAGIADMLPKFGLRPLSEVKADIDGAVAARKARGG